MRTYGTTRLRPSFVDRVGRGRPSGGEFSPRTRPEADQALVDTSLRPTAAEAARAGHGPEYILSDMVIDRCPQAVSWSVDAVEYANGWFAVEPVHAHFGDGTSIAFSAIPGDPRDEFIRQAVRDLAEVHELGPDGLHVDLWAHEQGADPRPQWRPARDWAESLGRELRTAHPDLAHIDLRAAAGRWSTAATAVQRNGVERPIDLTATSAWLAAVAAAPATDTGVLRLHIG